MRGQEPTEQQGPLDKSCQGTWGQQDKFRWKEGVEVRHSLGTQTGDPANSLLRWLTGHQVREMPRSKAE